MIIPYSPHLILFIFLAKYQHDASNYPRKPKTMQEVQALYRY